MAHEYVGVTVFRAPDGEGSCGQNDIALLCRLHIADKVARFRSRKFAVRALFFEPHDPLVDAGPVVEDIEERGVGICKIAVDVGWRDKVASFVGEQRLPLLKLTEVEPVGFVKVEDPDAMMDQQRCDGGHGAHWSIYDNAGRT